MECVNVASRRNCTAIDVQCCLCSHCQYWLASTWNCLFPSTSLFADSSGCRLTHTHTHTHAHTHTHTDPTIDTQPVDRLNQAVGADVTFSVSATGADAYQWMKDGVEIADTADTYSGTNISTLTVLSVNISDEGLYSCRVSNGSESVNSSGARLDVGEFVWDSLCSSPISLPSDAECGPLTDPANGMVDTTAGTTEGMIASYTCNTGYDLVGNMTRTCGADGVWNSTEPTCESE